MSKAWKIFLSSVGVILLALFFWYFQTIVIYVLISGILSLIGQPLMNLLDKIHFGKFKIPISIRAILVLIFFWAIIYGGIRVSLPIIFSQAKTISNIDVNDLQEKIDKPLSILDKTLKTYNLEGISYDKLNIYITEKLKQIIDFSDLSNILASLVRILGELIVAIFSITFITYFFLTDSNLFYKIILYFVPDKYDERFLKALKQIQFLLSRYFIGVSLESVILTILRTLGFTLILGINFKVSLVVSLFSGVINVIPYIGNLIGYVFGVIYIYITNANLDFYNEMIPLMIYMTIIYFTVQIIDNILFQPLIYARSVKAHPLEIFFVIFMAGSVGGIIGMVLAIPVYTALRVIANEFFSQYKVVKEITKSLDE
jgi:predicted PurR-regulated permease PerM